MKYVIDRFGEDVETEVEDDEFFVVTTEVSLSPTFYSWVFQFAGEIRILEPSNAVNELNEMMRQLMTAQSL
jgi:predicted DNA-binding transcriptional regulator YafY